MDNANRSYEETARKRNTALASLSYALSWVALVISGLIALIALSSLTSVLAGGAEGLIPTVITIAVFGGLAYLIWRNKDNLRVEYDYTFTPLGAGKADLDVAKVMGNSRRKLMTSLSLKSVESAGDVRHASFNRYLTMKDVKKHNWFVNRDAKLSYFYFVKNNVKHMIVLELSDEMIGRVKPFLGYSIWQN
ncbi:MAG: hypothetical protein GX558_01580 [Clostridiales bacterium]|mgnify:CR=1 FL=1|nr:hypothetical protein [Clostridiales bacterium]